MLGFQTAVALAVLLCCHAATAAPPHTVIVMLHDDLGSYDTQVYGNMASPTPFMRQLSQSGVILNRHYVYKWCSPTRRSLLSGRLPVHVTGSQADVCSNFLPLEFTLLSQKFKSQNYSTHFVGKGHLGYQTVDHLPVNRGFDSHVGYLCGQEQYMHGLNLNAEHDCPGDPPSCVYDFWDGQAPGKQDTDEIFYSANFYTDQAMRFIKETPADQPLFIYYPIQNVHEPYQDPPAWEQVKAPGFWDATYANMLAVLDKAVQNVTQALHDAGRFDDALMIISSDNGGVDRGNNFFRNESLRGLKATPWEGGTRVMAFLAGGYLPAPLHGTSFDGFIHISDWYPTLCNLIGADPSDKVNIDGGVHDVDGIDVWPMLNGVAGAPTHEWLPITEDSIIYQQRWKLLTQADSTWWYTPDNQHIPDTRSEWPCRNKMPAADGACNVCVRDDPCLFDLLADMGERHDLSKQNPDLVKTMQAKLATYKPYVTGKMNSTQLEPYECVTDIRQYWGNFSGPCCKRKSTGILLD